MKIDLKEIFDLQNELDKEIHKLHNVTYESIRSELKLALYVELAECANEIRSFKFWSLKQPSEKNVILEEYVDGLHFITAIGISYSIRTTFEIINQKLFANKRDITNGFINLFSTINEINDKDSCYNWYLNFLNFGFKLGFTFEEIMAAYKNKCAINHKRQKNKY